MPRKQYLNPVQRLPSVDARAHILLAPTGRLNGLTGPMRLVALLLMLWEEDSGRARMEWDHDQIADRTGLSTAMVAQALDQLRQVHLVKETAAGPKLTWDRFQEVTLPAWKREWMLRPTRQSGSPSHSEKGKPDGNSQVEEVGAGDGGAVGGHSAPVGRDGDAARSGAGRGDGRDAPRGLPD